MRVHSRDLDSPTRNASWVRGVRADTDHLSQAWAERRVYKVTGFLYQDLSFFIPSPIPSFKDFIAKQPQLFTSFDDCHLNPQPQ